MHYGPSFPEGHGGGRPLPNRKSRRAERKQSQSRRREGPASDTEVSLTAEGRALFQQMLEAASVEAGRALCGEDLLEVLRRVRKETGDDDLDLSKPQTMECFKKHLRQIGREASRPGAPEPQQPPHSDEPPPSATHGAN